MQHVRDLVLYLLADGMKPTWIVPEVRDYVTFFSPGPLRLDTLRLLDS
jgi:hypothetical protein